jgi:hypothetical protein
MKLEKDYFNILNILSIIDLKQRRDQFGVKSRRYHYIRTDFYSKGC